MKEEIVNLQNTGDIEGLVELLGATKDVLKLGEIRDALLEFGEKAVDSLIKIFEKETNGGRVEQAALTLSKIKDSRAVVPLLEAREKATFARRSITLALGTLGDNRAVEPLLKALDRLDEFQSYEGTEVVEALGDLGDRRAVKPLIFILKNTKRKGDSRKAAKALGKLFDRKAVKPLIKALKHPDSITRNEAAGALGVIGDKKAIKPLLEYMNVEKDKYDRMRALWSLAGIVDEKIPDLIESFRSDGGVSRAWMNVNEIRSPKRIERAQKALAEKGLYKGPISGKFNQDTKNAIIAFQKKKGIAVSGALTGDTMEQL